MKIRVSPPRQRQKGVALVVILALLSIMLLYVTANTRSLYHLGRELKLLEQRQIQRLERSQTNTPSPAILKVKPASAEP